MKRWVISGLAAGTVAAAGAVLLLNSVQHDCTLMGGLVPEESTLVGVDLTAAVEPVELAALELCADGRCISASSGQVFAVGERPAPGDPFIVYTSVAEGREPDEVSYEVTTVAGATVGGSVDEIEIGDYWFNGEGCPGHAFQAVFVGGGDGVLTPAEPTSITEILAYGYPLGPLAAP